MEKNEFKDRLFDVLNDTDNLPIQDIMVDNRNDIISVYLADGSRFSVRVENCGISKQEIKNAFKKSEIKFHPISFLPVDDELIKENQSCIFIR